MTNLRVLIYLVMLFSFACVRAQVVLEPRSDNADRIAQISWVIFVGAAIIFLLVMVILALALYGPPRIRMLVSQRTLIVGAGIAFPLVVLSVLLFYTLRAASFMIEVEGRPAVRIEVNGEMWWWRVRYLDSAGQVLFETANDIRIPSGEPVTFLLKSDNVIHSFWIPNLAGKLDMVPGRVNRLRLRAREPGVYQGQCAEYCGAQHAKMRFDVQVLAPDAYQDWLALQLEPAREPVDPLLQTGMRHFMQACAQCHAIRGTAAKGTLGPDLTHVGSRHTLAAGVLPNNVGSLAGWIAGSQHIKPGNQMPSFTNLSGPDLRAIAHYMESLK